MGQLVIGVAGAAVGGLIGGPLGASIGWGVGAAVGGYLFAPKSRTVGPRMTDLNLQGASYGDSIPILRGTVRTAGRVIWMSDVAERRSERKVGKNASVTEFDYRVSLAVALCEGPISGVRRIWCNKTLIADWSAAPPDAETSLLEQRYAGGAKVYLGSETQLPDEEMEAHEGAGLVPGYRGLAYIRFTDFHLGPWGNQIPNFEFEVVVDGGETWPVEVGDYSPGVLTYESGATYDQSAGRLFVCNITKGQDGAPDYELYIEQQTIEVVNGGAANVVSSGRLPLPYYNETVGAWYGQFDDVFVKQMVGNMTGAFLVQSTSESWEGEASPAGNRVVYLSYCGGWNVWGAITNALNTSIPPPGFPAALTGGAAPAFTWNLLVADFDMFRYGDVIYGVSAVDSSGAKRHAVLWRCSLWRDPDTGDLAGGISTPSYIGQLYQASTSFSQPILFVNADGIYVGNGADPEVLYHVPFAAPETASLTVWTLPNPGAGQNFIAVRGDVVIYTGESSGERIYAARLPAGGGNAVALGSTLSAYTFGRPILGDDETGYILNEEGLWETRGVLGDTAPTLEDVLVSLCEKAGLQTAQVDASSCSGETLEGYVLPNRASARSAIEPLLLGYQVDAVESDGQIKFVKREAVPTLAATLADADLGAGREAAAVRMESRRRQDAELPQIVDVTFLDVAGDYIANTQSRQRGQVLSEEKTSVNLPVAMTAQQAADAAARLLFGAWAERTERTMTLDRRGLRLDPTDVIDVETAAATYRMRIESRSEENGLVTLTGVDLDAALYAVTGAAVDGEAGDGIQTRASTELHLLESPPLVDGDDESGIYVHAGPATTGSWGAATVYRVTSDSAFVQEAAIDSAATWGLASTALDAPEQLGLPDEENTVTISLRYGSLASTTYEEQLASTENLAWLGGELISFRTATNTGGSTWVLSGLLRGLRGTDYACGTHAIGEKFVLLDAGHRFASVPSGVIGQAVTWRGVSLGDSPLVGDSEVETFGCYAMKPLSPVEVRAQRSAGSTPIIISWVRRGRIDAAWRDYVDVPLGEDYQRFDVEVYDGDTLKRTYTDVTDAQTKTYTTDEQIADFGSPAVGTVTFNVYQKSATVGRGWPGTVETTFAAAGSYSRDWDDNSTANQTKYGATGTSISASGGQFIVNCSTTGIDGKIKFDLVSAHGDGEAEVDVVVPAADPSWPGSRSIGLVFRTTSWQTNNASFAYAAVISDGGIVSLYRGSDSTPTAVTLLGSYSTGVTSGTVTLKATYYGSALKVFVDGVERIAVTDGTFSTGYVGLYAGDIVTPFFATAYASYTFDNYSLTYY